MARREGRPDTKETALAAARLCCAKTLRSV